MMSAVIYNFALIVTLCFFDFLEGEPTYVLTNIVFFKWANPGHFLFIFVLFLLQFQYKLKKA